MAGGAKGNEGDRDINMMHGGMFDVGVWPRASGHGLIGALFWLVVIVAFLAAINYVSRK
jgi:uncharacterized membrane protein